MNYYQNKALGKTARTGELAASRAAQMMDAEHAAIFGMLPENEKMWFEWLFTQSHDLVTRILAFCAATSVTCIAGRAESVQVQGGDRRLGAKSN